MRNLSMLLFVFSDMNALKYSITAIREEMGDNISVLVNCAGKLH